MTVGKLMQVDAVDLDDLCYESFFEHYFQREWPVVVRGVAADWAARNKWTPDGLLQSLQESSGVKRRHLWHESSERFLTEDDVALPEFMRQCLDPSRCYRRETDCRFWIHKQGNITHWHYDGNALFGFNVQVKGSKEFLLVSPDTPLPCYPFDFRVCPLDCDKVAREVVYARVALQEGDMLYLPPFWFHRVTALTEYTINVNWVATRKADPVPSKTALRELEILKFARITGTARLLSRYVTQGGKSGYFGELYGGGGLPFVRELTRNVSALSAIRRGLEEITMAGRLLFRWRDGQNLLWRRPRYYDAVFPDAKSADKAPQPAL